MRHGTGPIAATVLLALAACAGASPSPSPGASPNGGMRPAGSSAPDAAPAGMDASSADDFRNATPGAPAPVPKPPAHPDTAANACGQIESKSAGLPVKQSDIIFVIDNSGNMTEEIAQVRDQLNQFVAALDASDLDARVVMISAPIQGTDWFGICVPAPLGNGSCPNDTNPPRYTHVAENVLGTNPPITTPLYVQNSALLDQFMYTFSQWRDVLRPEVSRNIIVVTDVDSATSAEYFTAWIKQQLEFTSAAWRFSGVFCLDASCAQPSVWAGSRVGKVYQQLVDATSGTAVQIAAQGFDAILQTLATDIVATAAALPCEWRIPPPPDGKTLDPERVNMRFTGGDGVPQTVLAVDKAGDCDKAGGGWFYDDLAQPQRISVCAQTCDVMRLQPKASVEIAFGCKRERNPIVE